MHLEKIKAFFLSVCSVIILASCASSDDVGRVQWELNDIRTEIKAVKARLPSGEGQFKGIEESQQATARAVSDLFIKTQELSGDVQLITGQLEEGQYHNGMRLEETKKNRESLAADLKEIKTVIDNLEKRLAKLEETRTAAQQEKKEDTAGKVKQKEKKPASSDIKDIYMAAYGVFKDGRTTEAREKFTSFIKDYPDSEYTDNARFWIAESYYSEKSHEDAILAYEDLFRKNPDSDKIPGAMLNQGLAFYALKDKETGRLILEKLVEKFPDSEQAKASKKKLEESKPVKK